MTGTAYPVKQCHISDRHSLLQSLKQPILQGSLSLARSASRDYGYCYSRQHITGDDTVGRTVRNHTVRQRGLLRNHNGHLQIGGKGKPRRVLLVRANPPSLNSATLKYISSTNSLYMPLGIALKCWVLVCTTMCYCITLYYYYYYYYYYYLY